MQTCKAGSQACVRDGLSHDEIALLRRDDIPYDSRQINGYSKLTLITGRIELLGE